MTDQESSSGGSGPSRPQSLAVTAFCHASTHMLAGNQSHSSHLTPRAHTKRHVVVGVRHAPVDWQVSPSAAEPPLSLTFIFIFFFAPSLPMGESPQEALWDGQPGQRRERPDMERAHLPPRRLQDAPAARRAADNQPRPALRALVLAATAGAPCVCACAVARARPSQCCAWPPSTLRRLRRACRVCSRLGRDRVARCRWCRGCRSPKRARPDNVDVRDAGALDRLSGRHAASTSARDAAAWILESRRWAAGGNRA